MYHTDSRGYLVDPLMEAEIARDRESAIEAYGELDYVDSHYHLYSNGLRIDGHVGAVALDPEHGRELLQYLGEDLFHTVFEAELVGIRLALQLVSKLPRTATHCTIHIDNQAAIRALTSRPKARPAQHLILAILEFASPPVTTSRSPYHGYPATRVFRATTRYIASQRKPPSLHLNPFSQITSARESRPTGPSQAGRLEQTQDGEDSPRL